MLAVEVYYLKPADGAADQNVRWEMLLTADARRAYRGGQTVNKQRGQRAGVFVGDDASDRPCGCCMFRRERNAALTESSAIVVLQRPLAAERVLHCIDWNQAIDCCFPSQNAGFNFVI